MQNSKLVTTATEPISDLTKKLIQAVGEDPHRQGLVRTPLRVEKAMKFLTSGYHSNIDEILNGAIFDEDYDEMVLIKNIDIFSLCEHHLLPFYGKCHVGYIPDGKVIGLSKIPRLVDHFSKRLQIQERLTNQIAQHLMEALKPRGVGVVIEALHLCMAMRGVEKQNAVCNTSAMLGGFRTDSRTRMEFMEMFRTK
jgi:GTP cyclohydrolase IA